MARAGRKDRGLFQRTLKSGEKVWAVRVAVQGRMQQFSPFKSKGDARAFYEKTKTEQMQGRFFPEKYATHGPSGRRQRFAKPKWLPYLTSSYLSDLNRYAQLAKVSEG